MSCQEIQAWKIASLYRTMDELARNQDTTEPTVFADVGSVVTDADGGITPVSYSEQDSEPDSQEPSQNGHAESEYFDPDPYDEAAEANETEFFSLGRRG